MANGNGYQQSIHMQYLMFVLKTLGVLIPVLIAFWTFVAQPNVAAVARGEVLSAISVERTERKEQLDRLERKIDEIHRYLLEHK